MKGNVFEKTNLANLEVMRKELNLIWFADLQGSN